MFGSSIWNLSASLSSVKDGAFNTFISYFKFDQITVAEDISGMNCLDQMTQRFFFFFSHGKFYYIKIKITAKNNVFNAMEFCAILMTSLRLSSCLLCFYFYSCLNIYLGELCCPTSISEI